eukprot:8509638-Alexandrium_andersonii.AAC.1
MLAQRRGASERVESWSGSCRPMASALADVRTVGSAIWTFGTSMLLGPRSSWGSLEPPCSAGPGMSGLVRPLLLRLLSRSLFRSAGGPVSSRRGPGHRGSRPGGA